MMYQPMGKDYQTAKAEMDVSWRDAIGETLLHYAARRGDMEEINTLIDRGASCLVLSEEGFTPLDLARFWGYADAAEVLQVRMAGEAQGVSLPAFGVTSFDALCQRPRLFANMIHLGLIAQLADLAKKDSAVFSPALVLQAGADGLPVIVDICRQGQLEKIMQPEIWADEASFAIVKEKIPPAFLTAIDAEGFYIACRQKRLQEAAKAAGSRLPKGPQHGQ